MRSNRAPGGASQQQGGDHLAAHGIQEPAALAAWFLAPDAVVGGLRVLKRLSPLSGLERAREHPIFGAAYEVGAAWYRVARTTSKGKPASAPERTYLLRHQNYVHPGWPGEAAAKQAERKRQGSRLLEDAAKLARGHDVSPSVVHLVDVVTDDAPPALRDGRGPQEPYLVVTETTGETLGRLLRSPRAPQSLDLRTIALLVYRIGSILTALKRDGGMVLVPGPPDLDAFTFEPLSERLAVRSLDGLRLAAGRDPGERPVRYLASLTAMLLTRSEDVAASRVAAPALLERSGAEKAFKTVLRRAWNDDKLPAEADLMAAAAAQAGRTCLELVKLERPSGSRAPQQNGVLQPGRLAGSRYHVERLFDDQGQALLYQAADHMANGMRSTVLVKAAKEAAGGEGDRYLGLRNLTDEAKVLLELRRDGLPVPQYFDLERPSAKEAMLVMEYIHAPTLAAWVEGQGPFPPREALAIVRQVAAFLKGIHGERGDKNSRYAYIWCDLKAENLLLSRTGEVTCIDFGSVLKRYPNRGTHKGDRALMLTGIWAPPEVDQDAARTFCMPYSDSEADSWRWIDCRFDIYSLGVLLVYLLTGEHPKGWPSRTFEDGQPLLNDVRKPPDSVKSRLSSFGKPIQELIEKAVEPDPGKRFQSAAELAAKLDQVYFGLREVPLPTPILSACPRPDGSTVLAYSFPIRLEGLGYEIHLSVSHPEGRDRSSSFRSSGALNLEPNWHKEIRVRGWIEQPQNRKRKSAIAELVLEPRVHLQSFTALGGLGKVLVKVTVSAPGGTVSVTRQAKKGREARVAERTLDNSTVCVEDTGAQPFEPYTYRVYLGRAKEAAGTATEVCSFAAPQPLQASRPEFDGRAVRFSWNAAPHTSGVLLYELNRDAPLPPDLCAAGTLRQSVSLARARRSPGFIGEGTGGSHVYSRKPTHDTVDYVLIPYHLPPISIGHGEVAALGPPARFQDIPLFPAPEVAAVVERVHGVEWNLRETGTDLHYRARVLLAQGPAHEKVVTGPSGSLSLRGVLEPGVEAILELSETAAGDKSGTAGLVTSIRFSTLPPAPAFVARGGPRARPGAGPYQYVLVGGFADGYQPCGQEVLLVSWDGQKWDVHPAAAGGAGRGLEVELRDLGSKAPTKLRWQTAQRRRKRRADAAGRLQPCPNETGLDGGKSGEIFFFPPPRLLGTIAKEAAASLQVEVPMGYDALTILDATDPASPVERETVPIRPGRLRVDVRNLVPFKSVRLTVLGRKTGGGQEVCPDAEEVVPFGTPVCPALACSAPVPAQNGNREALRFSWAPERFASMCEAKIVISIRPLAARAREGRRRGFAVDYAAGAVAIPFPWECGVSDIEARLQIKLDGKVYKSSVRRLLRHVPEPRELKVVPGRETLTGEALLPAGADGFVCVLTDSKGSQNRLLYDLGGSQTEVTATQDAGRTRICFRLGVGTATPVAAWRPYRVAVSAKHEMLLSRAEHREPVEAYGPPEPFESIAAESGVDGLVFKLTHPDPRQVTRVACRGLSSAADITWPSPSSPSCEIREAAAAAGDLRRYDFQPCYQDMEGPWNGCEALFVPPPQFAEAKIEGGACVLVTGGDKLLDRVQLESSELGLTGHAVRPGDPFKIPISANLAGKAFEVAAVGVIERGTCFRSTRVTTRLEVLPLEDPDTLAEIQVESRPTAEDLDGLKWTDPEKGDITSQESLAVPAPEVRIRFRRLLIDRGTRNSLWLHVSAAGAGARKEVPLDDEWHSVKLNRAAVFKGGCPASVSCQLLLESPQGVQARGAPREQPVLPLPEAAWRRTSPDEGGCLVLGVAAPAGLAAVSPRLDLEAIDADGRVWSIEAVRRREDWVVPRGTALLGVCGRGLLAGKEWDSPAVHFPPRDNLIGLAVSIVELVKKYHARLEGLEAPHWGSELAHELEGDLKALSTPKGTPRDDRKELTPAARLFSRLPAEIPRLVAGLLWREGRVLDRREIPAGARAHRARLEGILGTMAIGSAAAATGLATTGALWAALGLGALAPILASLFFYKHRRPLGRGLRLGPSRPSGHVPRPNSAGLCIRYFLQSPLQACSPASTDRWLADAGAELRLIGDPVLPARTSAWLSEHFRLDMPSVQAALERRSTSP